MNTSTFSALAAAVLPGGMSNLSTSSFCQRPQIQWNTRTPEEWRELDRQRELKRAARKARRNR